MNYILISSSHGNTFGIYHNFTKFSNFNKNQSHSFYHHGFEFVINSPNHYLPKLFAPKTNERLYFQNGWGRVEHNFTYIRSKNCFIALTYFESLVFNNSYSFSIRFNINT